MCIALCVLHSAVWGELCMMYGVSRMLPLANRGCGKGCVCCIAYCVLYRAVRGHLGKSCVLCTMYLHSALILVVGRDAYRVSRMRIAYWGCGGRCVSAIAYRVRRIAYWGKDRHAPAETAETVLKFDVCGGRGVCPSLCHNTCPTHLLGGWWVAGAPCPPT